MLEVKNVENDFVTRHTTFFSFQFTKLIKRRHLTTSHTTKIVNLLNYELNELLNSLTNAVFIMNCEETYTTTESIKRIFYPVVKRRIFNSLEQEVARVCLYVTYIKIPVM